MADNLVDITQRRKYVFEALNTTQINNPAANISTSATMFSHNRASPPYPMPNRIFTPFDLENAGDMRDLLVEPQVVRTPHIYLALNSPQLPTRGAFGSLGLDTLPIEQKGDFFSLSKDIAYQWSRLEGLIFSTIGIFSKDTLDISNCAPPLAPSRCNYLAAYRTYHQAYGNARRAQRAFRPLLSYLLFSLAVLDKKVWIKHEDKGLGKRPMWQIRMQQVGVPFTWIDELRSLLRALSCGEIQSVGAIVASISEVGASRVYRTLVTFNVPCWYLLTPGVDNAEEMRRQQQGFYLPSPGDCKISYMIKVSYLPFKVFVLTSIKSFSSTRRRDHPKRVTNSPVPTRGPFTHQYRRNRDQSPHLPLHLKSRSPPDLPTTTPMLSAPSTPSSKRRSKIPPNIPTTSSSGVRVATTTS
jgi:hypothetical protein